MNKLYLTVDEVATALGISKGAAYKLIRKCNEGLQERGYLTIAGRVPAKYFGEKYYGFEISNPPIMAETKSREGDDNNAGVSG